MEYKDYAKEQKYCDCPEPCEDCMKAGHCELCDKPINIKEIEQDKRMLNTLKRELGLKT